MKHSQQRGFSLIEWMMVLFLVSMILHYLPNTYSMISTISIKIEKEQQQMNQLTTLLYHLKPSVSLSGFLGCQSMRASHAIIVHGTLPYSNLHKGEAFTLYKAGTGGWFPPLPSILNKKVAPFTDVIQFEYAGPWHASLQNRMHTRIDPLKIPLPIHADTWYVIADCERAELFKGELLNIGKETYLQPHQPLSKAYDHTAVVSPWLIVVFYLSRQEAFSELTLMRNSLLTDPHALAIMSDIKHWSITHEADLLQVDMGEATDPLTVWLHFDNA